MNVFISGATDGIGKQTALELAQLGHSVFIHGKNIDRLNKTKTWILSQVPHATIKIFLANFASLQEVKQMAKNFLAEGLALDVLINNAGVFEKQLAYSVDGFERTFAINHLAPFYLTTLFLPLLKSQASAKIINVASMAQASSIDFNALNGEKGFNPYKAYELSKLCNVLFTFKLARELNQYPIAINALHPGEISTKILHAGWGLGGESWHLGAATPIYLATMENLSTGHYYVNKQKAKGSKAAYSIENQDRLWRKSIEMCALEN